MSKKFKTAKAVRELLKDESSIAALASKYEITTTTIRNWQNQFLNGIEAVFEQRDYFSTISFFKYLA